MYVSILLYGIIAFCLIALLIIKVLDIIHAEGKKQLEEFYREHAKFVILRNRLVRCIEESVGSAEFTSDIHKATEILAFHIIGGKFPYQIGLINLRSALRYIELDNNRLTHEDIENILDILKDSDPLEKSQDGL